MEDLKQQRLEAAGWKVGDAEDFLELSPEESATIDAKIELSRQIRPVEIKPSPDYDRERTEEVENVREAARISSDYLAKTFTVPDR